MIDLYPNETLPLMWVIFVVVLFVLSKFVFKPTLQIIDEREQKTDGFKEEAIALVEKTKSLTAAYEQKAAEGRQKAALTREKIISEARAGERQLIEEARSQNEQVLQEMKARLEREKKEAELRLRQYAQVLAREIVDKVLERAA